MRRRRSSGQWRQSVSGLGAITWFVAVNLEDDERKGRKKKTKKEKEEANNGVGNNAAYGSTRVG